MLEFVKVYAAIVAQAPPPVYHRRIPLGLRGRVDGRVSGRTEATEWRRGNERRRGREGGRGARVGGGAVHSTHADLLFLHALPFTACDAQQLVAGTGRGRGENIVGTIPTFIRAKDKHVHTTRAMAALVLLQLHMVRVWLYPATLASLN